MGPITKICEKLGHANPWKLPRPTGVEHMLDIIIEANEACSCDLCRPDKYLPSKNSSRMCPANHAQVVFETFLNPLGLLVNNPVGPQLSSQKGEYETMHLARSIGKYMDVSVEYMNREQLKGLLAFTGLWEELHGEDEVTLDQVRLIYESANEMFFGGVIPCKFGHKSCPDGALAVTTLESEDERLSMISIDLDSIRWYGYRNFVLAVVQVVLHEAVHVFLNRYPCYGCKSYHSSEEVAAGHGRAFQIIARKIEELCSGFLGVPMSLYGPKAMFLCWDKSLTKKPPSRHDLVSWGLRCTPYNSDGPES